MRLSLADLRVWAVLLTLGLAASLWVSNAERGAAVVRAKASAEKVEALTNDLDARTNERDQARAHAAAADARLTDFAADSARTLQEQAAASARMAAELADVNRRLRAAQQEISRAPSGLRLDDPLPRSLRDNLACARGATDACAGAQTDSGLVPSRAADAAGTTGPAAGGDDRA